MNPPIASDEGRSLTFRNQVRRPSKPGELLEVLLALDRSVVEVSMQLYNLSQSDRRRMRSDNRRLHAFVRHQFPRLLKRAPGKKG
jgi:hypothetical protein